MATAILVTGGAGYIGSHTCKALAHAGFEPVTYDNLGRGHREAVRWGPLVVGELADQVSLVQAMRRHQVAAVMHFAAYAYVGESVTAPELYFRNNVSNSLVLLDAMREAEIRHIVFSSTCATYGMPDRIPIAEDTPQQPVNPYGESKLMIERMLHWFGEAHGLCHAALRYFNAAGADPDGEIGEHHEPETHLIPLVLQAALDPNKPISIFGTDYPTPDGTAIRDYIHVRDLAEAHVLALEYLRTTGKNLAVNLGTGQGHSVREVIDAAERVTGRTIARREMPRRPGDPPRLVADPGRARTTLSWSARHSGMDEIIAHAWAWHQSRNGRRIAAAAAT
jgi:UDP-arabinose 4-epimerase